MVHIFLAKINRRHHHHHQLQLQATNHPHFRENLLTERVRRKKEKMGRLFVVNLEGKIYSCKHCRTHLAVCEDIVSKSFHCRHGKAYLFSKVVNVSVGEKEERMMMTGMHTVADIFCVGCGSIVGWKYETAHEKGQKYKEGKSVLERYKVYGPDGSNYWISHESHIGGSDADDA